MRSMEFEEFMRIRREKRLRLIALENTFIGRAPGNRPRDPEKEKLLTKMDIERRRRLIESGKLEVLGPRLWRWRVDFNNDT
jgi:hypothetical protein